MPLNCPQILDYNGASAVTTEFANFRLLSIALSLSGLKWKDMISIGCSKNLTPNSASPLFL